MSEIQSAEARRLQSLRRRLRDDAMKADLEKGSLQRREKGDELHRKLQADIADSKGMRQTARAKSEEATASRKLAARDRRAVSAKMRSDAKDKRAESRAHANLEAVRKRKAAADARAKVRFNRAAAVPTASSQLGALRLSAGDDESKSGWFGGSGKRRTRKHAKRHAKKTCQKTYKKEKAS